MHQIPIVVFVNVPIVAVTFTKSSCLISTQQTKSACENVFLSISITVSNIRERKINNPYNGYHLRALSRCPIDPDRILKSSS